MMQPGSTPLRHFNDESPLGLRRILSQSTDSLNMRNRTLSVESLIDEGDRARTWGRPRREGRAGAGLRKAGWEGIQRRAQDPGERFGVRVVSPTRVQVPK